MIGVFLLNSAFFFQQKTLNGFEPSSKMRKSDRNLDGAKYRNHIACLQEQFLSWYPQLPLNCLVLRFQRPKPLTLFPLCSLIEALITDFSQFKQSIYWNGRLDAQQLAKLCCFQVGELLDRNDRKAALSLALNFMHEGLKQVQAVVLTLTDPRHFQ